RGLAQLAKEVVPGGRPRGAGLPATPRMVDFMNPLGPKAFGCCVDSQIQLPTERLHPPEGNTRATRAPSRGSARSNPHLRLRIAPRSGGRANPTMNPSSPRAAPSLHFAT